MQDSEEKRSQVPPSFDDYTYLNRWGLSFLGIWQGQHEAGSLSHILHRLHVTILFVMMTLLLIPQWLDMYVLWGNMNAFAETFVLNVFTICAFLKLMNFTMVADVFQDVKSTMNKNWLSTMNDSGPRRGVYRDILIDMANKAHNYTRRYGIMMYSTASMYFMSPFVGMQEDNVRVRKYPFFGWYYFDKSSDTIYALCYISQVMIGVVVGTCNYAMDSIFLVAIYHCCAQLRMLQYDVQKLGEADHSSPEEIAHLVRKHEKEIRTSRKLEAIFNGCSVQQLMVSCIIICIIGFKLIIALSKGGNEFLVYVAFMFVALLQIFLYCKPGDELITQSTALADATYQSSWRRLNVESIRKVAMIILRSQRPLKMTAGSFLVLSMPNFTKILKTSLSFLSLLRAMYKDSS